MNEKYFLPLAVIVAGVLIAGAVIWNGSRPAGTGAPGPGNPPAVDIKNVDTEGRPFIGRADAPVTMAFWSDYQCPFCKSFEVGGVPQIATPAAFPDIVEKYVTTGKVRVVFMDFAFLGDDSITAAVYGRSIWQLYPERYFVWRTAMYTAQDEEYGGFGDAASIDKLNATIAGIDAASVAADVRANRAAYEAAAAADRAEGQKHGVNATPSFIVGKQLIQGAYPLATFEAALDSLL